jgi:hypothetical protein
VIEEVAVPSWRLKEEADKKRAAEAKCAELEACCKRLERENRAFRIGLVALGADPKEIIATLDAN